MLPRGSVIVFNSMVFHRAGINRSGRIRRAVNHVIGAPILAQQVDMPAMLGREAPSDPWLAGYLGLSLEPDTRGRRVAAATNSAGGLARAAAQA